MLIAACLLVLGVVMVHSASMDLSGETTLSGVLLSRPAALAVAAFACMLVGACVPVERLGGGRGWSRPALWILLAAAALVLAVYIPGVGREANGARRWIQVGPLGFQPSEIAKWGLPIVIAAYAVANAARIREFLRGFAAPLSIVAVLCAVIAVSDLGTAVLIMLVALAMLIACGARLTWPLVAAPLIGAGIALMVAVSPYRRNRILAYLDPLQDQAGIGYHIIQSMAALNGGGLAGRGLGNSVQKFGYLPESNTDFIFAIIGEELGVIGAAMVVLLYLGLAIAGFSVIRRSIRACPDAVFSRQLALGILMTVLLQAAINLSVVTGLAPTKGIALPLVSHGGTGWLLTALSLGFLVSIDRASDRAEAKRALRTDDSPALDSPSLDSPGGVAPVA